MIDSQQFDSMIDSILSPWKPIGRELGHRALLQSALMPVFAPPTTTPWCFPLIGAWSRNHGVDRACCEAQS